MSEATHYWPGENQPGEYSVERKAGDEKDWEWDGVKWRRGMWFRDTSEMISMGYLGVRREPATETRVLPPGYWYTPSGLGVATEMDARDFLPAKPMTEDEEDKATAEQENYEAANLAIDEWRTIQHKPAEVERWAYRWAVELCERLGAR
jgi:hypothetical protein